MTNVPVPSRDRVFLRALVASARTDAPPVGAKSRALGNVDARARSDRAALSGSLRVLAGVAVLGASLSWSLSAPSSVPARPAVDCAIGDERAQARSLCGTAIDGPSTAWVGRGDGASSGSG